MSGVDRPDAVPDTPHVACPWCGAPILLSRFAASDEEVGVDVAVCPQCGRRAPLPLPRDPGR
jgi:DNA-directed RNA polymerase subunit RPC12/RpoP